MLELLACACLACSGLESDELHLRARGGRRDAAQALVAAVSGVPGLPGA